MLVAMPGPFDSAAIRAYRDRDWKRVREAKERFWAEDHRRRGPLAGLAIGAMLWEQMRSIDPTWPDAEQRAEDFAHHVELAERIQRVAHVFAHR
jgi:hypothetical protein